MARMSLQAAFDQARQWLESNDLDRAIGLSEHILQSYPNNLEAHRLLGEASLANRQLDRAQESFEYILAADPENIPAHVGLGVALERRGKLEQAVREFEQALEIKPDMPELRSQVLRLYTEGGIENPQLRLSHAGLARLYAKGQMLPQAVNEFRKVIKNQPDRYDARVALAETLWNNEQEEEASALSHALIAERPNLIKPHLLLGYMQLASGQQEGEQHWDKAANFDPYMTIAQSIFEVLPTKEHPQLEIDSWDEADWRRRRAEEHEQIVATRPMEVAQTPVQNEFAPGVGFFNRAEPVVNVNPDESDDFLASLLSLGTAPAASPRVVAPSSPSSAPTPPVNTQSDAGTSATTELDDELDMTSMQPFSLEPKSETPATAELDDELDISSMQPFSLSDLGLTDDELAGLDSLDHVQPSAQAPVSTPEASQISSGVSEDLETLESLDSFDEQLPQFSLPDETSPAVPDAQINASVEAEDDSDELDLENVRPFTFSELGLDDDEIASLQSLETLDEKASVDVQFPLLSDEEEDDYADLTADLQPFSMDEIEQSGNIPGELRELPAALQPFSLDEPTPAGRPRISGLTPDTGLDEPGEDDNESDSRSFSWQQPTLKAEPDFVSSLRETDPPPGSSLFHKLQQQRQSAPPPQEPIAPQDTTTIGENEDLGLFSLDNEPLRDDDLLESPKESPFTGIAQREGTARTPATPVPPEQPPAEETNLQGAIAAGDIQPFSLADLGLSEEEIAALGIDNRSSTSPDANASIHAEADLASLPVDTEEEELSEETPTSTANDDAFFSVDSLDFSEDDLPDFDFGPATSQPTSSVPALPHAEPVELDNLEDALDSGIIKPFSFADLGLTDEEIAQLNLGEADQADTAVDQTAASTLSDDLALPSLDLGEPATSQEAANPSESFTLDDLGLLDEELPSLDLGEPAASQEAADEAIHTATDSHKFEPVGEIDTLEEALDSGVVKPFSLADLGLSDEEIAMLNMGEEAPAASSAESMPAPTPAPVENIAPEDQRTLADILDLGEIPSSGEDLELTDAKIAELNIDEQAPASAQNEGTFDFGLEDDLQPFSLGDFGSTDQISFGTPPDAEPSSTKLGISDDELSGLTLDSQPSNASNLAADASSGDIAADRLLALGRKQGYIDISDIIAAVSNPEEEAERIEMIGQLLHSNNVEIRDGDEVIDMDAEYEDDEESFESAEPVSTDSPDMTPFSLAELGLSDEEIAMLGLDEETHDVGTEQADKLHMGTGEATFLDIAQDEQVLKDDFSILDIDDKEPSGSITEPLEFPSQAPVLDDDIATFSLNELDIVPDEPSISQAAAPSTPVRPTEPAESLLSTSSTSPSDPSLSILEQYLARVEQDPDNHALRLSVARACIRLGHIDVGVRHYKQLIKRNILLEDIADDLTDMIADNDDVSTLRQLHRTLGDVFSAEGKLIEAMQLYSWTADQPKYNQ